MEWISVEVQRPVVNEDVLFYDEDEKTVGCGYMGRDNIFRQSGEFDTLDFYSVSHWMPLPAPPNAR